jgi:hypothetical protein
LDVTYGRILFSIIVMWLWATIPLLGVSVSPYCGTRFLAEVAFALLAVGVNRRQGIPARVTVVTALICAPAAVWGSRVLDMAEYWRGLPLRAAFAQSGSSPPRPT